eukprot:m.22709 g.22709  ORF g.22709 m.22709 type:complete len:76 (-) comp8413_c1_seq1:857-1084(-)
MWRTLDDVKRSIERRRVFCCDPCFTLLVEPFPHHPLDSLNSFYDFLIQINKLDVTASIFRRCIHDGQTALSQTKR